MTAAAIAEKGSVAAWESIWRVAGPGLGSAIVRDAVARGDDVACVAGLLRSAFGPDPAAAALAEPEGVTGPVEASAIRQSPDPGSASAEQQPEPPREPVPYNEFPDGF